MGEFPDNLEYNYAAQMKKKVQAQFSSGSAVFINLKNVERTSLSCVQVLVAASKKASRENLGFVIAASDALAIVFRDLGLEQILLAEGES